LKQFFLQVWLAIDTNILPILTIIDFGTRYKPEPELEVWTLEYFSFS